MPEKDYYTVNPDKPCLKYLIQEFYEMGPNHDGANVVRENNDVRYNVWENQWPDGKKHDLEDEPARPWDGASDYRYRLADYIVDTLVSMVVVAFRKNSPKAQAVELSDIDEAGAQTKVIQWLMSTKMRSDLVSAVELSAQWFFEDGKTGLGVNWEREIAFQPYEVDFGLISKAIEQTGDLELIEFILDPDREDEAVARMGAHFRAFINSQTDVMPGEVPEIEDSVIRDMVRELRKDRKTIIAVPKLVKNSPKVEPLKAYQEVFIPHSGRNCQDNTCFVRQLLTETEVRVRARDEGWDKKFTEKVIDTKGYVSLWNENNQYVGGIDNGFSDEETNSHLIEIVTAYTRRFDKRGVHGVYYTVFNVFMDANEHGEDLVAKHGLLDYRHGKVPVVLGQRERIAKSWSKSRGIPKVVEHDQRIGKVAHDAMVDHISIAVTPAMIVFDDVNKLRIGAGQKLKASNPNRKPEYMKPPPFEHRILDLWQITRDSAKSQFGVMTPTSDPTEVMAIREKTIQNFFAMWQEAFSQIYLLCKQYLSPEVFARITGTPANMDSGSVEAMDEIDVFMEFDPATMDKEILEKQIKTIFQIAQNDRTNSIDMELLIKHIVKLVNPQMAGVFLRDKRTATQKLYKEVREDVVGIKNGMDFVPVENDPTAGQRLEVLQQILASPEIQEDLNKNPKFNEKLQLMVKNLEHSYNQTTVNPTRGRQGI